MKPITCGDNLLIMEIMPDNSIDLIYLDPPFFSGRNYEVIRGDESRSFSDTLEHFKEANAKEKVSFEQRSAEMKQYDERMEGGISAYLLWMSKRLRQMHRILKPTGSIYLHCDWHASHYLKIEMDKIFGYNSFRNEIVWVRSNDTGSSKSKASKLPCNTDSILFYTKSDNYKWEMPSYEADMEKFKLDDNDGKGKYYWDNLKTYSEERLADLKLNGEVKQRDSGKYSYKRYLSTSSGKIAYPNFWNDIPRLTTISKESLGYPTQKPEALLARIIKASSNEGDTVLDPFCGCGTALAVAKKLNRKYIGIDVSPIACKLTAKRLGLTEDTIEELKAMKPHEFQQWACDKMGANS